RSRRPPDLGGRTKRAIHVPGDVADMPRRKILMDGQFENMLAEEARLRRHFAAVAYGIVPELQCLDAAPSKRGGRRCLVRHDDGEEERTDAIRQRWKHWKHVRVEFLQQLTIVR